VQRTAGGELPGGSVELLFERLPRRYDVLAEVLSFGQNRRWRREMVGRVADRLPATVLDVATGTCAVALDVALRTDAWIAAVDLTETMLARGRENVVRRHEQDRISFALGRAEQLPFADASFDALTFTYLMRYVDDPDMTMRELVRVVKPGGIVAGLDFSVPDASPWRLGWWLYTRVALPAAGGFLGGRAWLRVGRFLGPSISEHHRRYPPDEIVNVWRRAGLVDVGARRMSLGGGLVVSGTRSDD
jgi:demethylmenaquinone methyltransferase/2-methoxy-6-polyprenyl-1,4-benzoquinol methylase